MPIKSIILNLRLRLDGVDLFGLLILLMTGWIGTVCTLAQIAEYRWQQKAIAEFHARMPAPVVIPQMFDFSGHERLINVILFGISSLTIWVVLVRWIFSKLYRLEIRRRADPTTTILQSSVRVPEFRETLGIWPSGDRSGDAEDFAHLASEHNADRNVNLQDLKYVEFEYTEPERLRAAARTSFRLAHGAVSPRLAEELENLGQALQREAEEAEGREIGP